MPSSPWPKNTVLHSSWQGKSSSKRILSTVREERVGYACLGCHYHKLICLGWLNTWKYSCNLPLTSYRTVQHFQKVSKKWKFPNSACYSSVLPAQALGLPCPRASFGSAHRRRKTCIGRAAHPAPGLFFPPSWACLLLVLLCCALQWPLWWGTFLRLCRSHTHLFLFVPCWAKRSADCHWPTTMCWCLWFSEVSEVSGCDY